MPPCGQVPLIAYSVGVAMRVGMAKDFISCPYKSYGNTWAAVVLGRLQ